MYCSLVVSTIINVPLFRSDFYNWRIPAHTCNPSPWVMVHCVGPWWIKVLMGLMGFPLVPQPWEFPLGTPPLQGAGASVPGLPALPN